MTRAYRPRLTNHDPPSMPDKKLLLNAVAAVLVTISASLVACGGSEGDPAYAKDGDTGAAAPATQQTLSPNPAMGDTTQALQGRTQQGMPAGAGDSGRPSLTTDSASRGTGVNPPPMAPTKRP